jgi:hypothetical protein
VSALLLGPHPFAHLALQTVLISLQYVEHKRCTLHLLSSLPCCCDSGVSTEGPFSTAAVSYGLAPSSTPLLLGMVVSFVKVPSSRLVP